jgi:isoleucyl-tRNA synthetase
MEDWPKCDASLIREDIERSMSLTKGIDEIVASERAKASYNLRWPLLRIMVRGKDAETNDAVRRFGEVLESQSNAKEIVYLMPGQEPPECEKIVAVEFEGGDVFIDFTVTPEIEAEALAREVIRRIQQMRKDMKLKVEQCISCDLMTDETHSALLEQWKDAIASEVRAERLSITDSPAGTTVKEWEFGGKTVTIGISPIE